MRVIPVIDLMQGLVVRGVAGRRSEYRPIVSQIAANAQPATVARAFVEQFDCDTVYVADLDAITHGQPNIDAWKAIAATGMRLWLDAGIGNLETYTKLEAAWMSQDISADIVIGLESFQQPDIRPLIDRIRLSSCKPIFSLDLRGGQPIHQVPAWLGRSPLEIAQIMHAAGFKDLIVLDLADVGTGSGTSTLPLCRQLAQALGSARVTAGGGIRELADLQALADAGCHAALLASALHDGRLTRADVLHFIQR
jgi:phosphoribosylformimino-5-aminoimidazole carboxamide ribotide isomerase